MGKPVRVAVTQNDKKTDKYKSRRPAPDTIRLTMQVTRDDFQALRKLVRHYGTADASDALRLSIYDALKQIEGNSEVV